MGNLSEENPGQENPISNRRFQPSFVSPLTLFKLCTTIRPKPPLIGTPNPALYVQKNARAVTFLLFFLALPESFSRGS